MSEQITQLLMDASRGDQPALDRLFPLVYKELHAIAHRAFRSRRRGHTLQTTALIHEVYLRLAGGELACEDRAHFFAISARAMRMILVDYVRSRHRLKRGAGAVGVTLDEAMAVEKPRETLLAVDEALTRLAGFDERKSRVVELHYFGGLSYEEIASEMQLSTATIHRELRLAKAWLTHELA